MNGIKRQFLLNAFAKSRGVPSRCLRADNDFSVVKCDYVRRSRNAHKLLMNCRYGFVRNQRRLDNPKHVQNRLSITRRLPEASLKRNNRKPPQPCEIQAHLALMILNVDQQGLAYAALTGGAFVGARSASISRGVGLSAG